MKAKPAYLRTLSKILFAACAALGGIALVGGPANATGEAGDMDHLFRGGCSYSHSNTGDPVMLPDSGMAHMHEFFGNDSTDQNSTVDSLQEDSPYLQSNPDKLQCDRETNKSSYWVPRITWNGTVVKPKRSGGYYATRTGLPPGGTTTTPFGFKLIANSQAAIAADTAPAGTEAKLYWHCFKQRSAHESIAQGTPDPPTSCPVDEKFGVPTLGVTVTFPQCWDGQPFDVKGGANTRHAVSNGSGGLICPGGFDKHLPQLSMFVDYDLPSQAGPLKVLGHDGAVLAPNNFHADYFNSEDLESLIQKCIREGQGKTLACGAGRGSEEDTTAPLVSNVAPINGKTGVRRATNVTATFSEAMDKATLTTSTVKLLKSGSTTPMAATVTLSSDGKNVTLDPSASLARRTTYTATIEGAKDLAGNPLATTTTWSFKTGRR